MGPYIRNIQILFLFFFLLFGCSQSELGIPLAETNQKTYIPQLTIRQNIPIALVSLDSQVLKFHCLNNEKCLPDIDLHGHILIDMPYELGLVYFLNPSSIFIDIYSLDPIEGDENIIHFNPQNGEVREIKLANNMGHSNFAVTGDRLLLSKDNSDEAIILRSDLQLTTVKVGIPINALIPINQNEVLALNKTPFEQNTQSVFEVARIDVNSGDVKKEIFKLPDLELMPSPDEIDPKKNYLISIEGISLDLKDLYCLYLNGNQPDAPKLGRFDIASSRLITFSTDPNVLRVSSGYAQYHEFLYTMQSGDYGPRACLVDMHSVTPIFDFTQYPDWLTERLLVIPYGDSFLLGAPQEVLLLSQDGKIEQRFPLPPEFVHQKYKLMRYPQ